MTYLKITAYFFLAFAAFFIYQGIVALNNGEDSFIMFLFAFIAIFMFFFRLRFIKKWSRKKDNE